MYDRSPFILITFWLLSLLFVARAEEWEEALPENDAVEFYLVSPLRGEAQLQVEPGLRAQLVAKLNLLAKLENRRLRRHTLGYMRVPTRLTPFHTWELSCRIPGRKTPTKSFLMRGRTWVGGFTENEFNAARYFTSASWQAALDKLSIPEVDDADRPAGYAERTEDAWPDAGAIDEAWELPENLSPEDDIIFYIKDKYDSELPEVQITPLPETREEFIAKLNKLGYLSKRCSSTRFSTQSNALYCRTPKVSYTEGFSLRADTWVGDTHGNEFNAARYFSPEDWARVEAVFGKTKLKGLSKNPYAKYKDKTEDTWLEPDSAAPKKTPVLKDDITMESCLPPKQIIATSKLGKGSVELHPTPGKEETLRAQLMCLRRLDAEMVKFGDARFRLPICQTYALFFSAEMYTSDTELFLWDTHIGGGFCGYWFDATHLFTPESWSQVRAKLASVYDKVGYHTPFTPDMPMAEIPPAPRVRDKPQNLSPSQNITFFMRTDSFFGKKSYDVEVEPVPELREEFIRKLNRIGKLENRFYARIRARGGRVHVNPPPALSYSLYCRTDDACYDGFELICRTWIGGLNAKRYLTQRSWEEVEAKLRTMHDEAVDADATPPEEETGTPSGPLSMSFYPDGEDGDPTAWRAWVQDTERISVQRDRGARITLSQEDTQALLTHMTAAEPITRQNVSPLAMLVYKLRQNQESRQPKHNKKQPSHRLSIHFIDADGDCIISWDWADFHPQREYHNHVNGYLMPDAVYDDIAQRLNVNDK